MINVPKDKCQEYDLILDAQYLSIINSKRPKLLTSDRELFAGLQEVIWN